MSLPIGEPVEIIEDIPQLRRREKDGDRVRLRTPDPRADAAVLYPPTHGSPEAESVWTYMGYGPFPDPGAMADWITGATRSEDPLWRTVADRDDRAVGMAALMNADPVHRRLELGHIWYIPEVHRAGVSTEAAYLMLEESFDHYRCRRVEWKCDSLNAPSRHAALRLGFGFEGIFRNHMIVKGRNRDTAWYAITDEEWPRVRETLRKWLDHPDPKPSLSEMMGRRGDG